MDAFDHMKEAWKEHSKNRINNIAGEYDYRAGYCDGSEFTSKFFETFYCKKYCDEIRKRDKLIVILGRGTKREE